MYNVSMNVGRWEIIGDVRFIEWSKGPKRETVSYLERQFGILMCAVLYSKGLITPNFVIKI